MVQALDWGERWTHHWDQLYLKQIRYADLTEQSETKYLISMRHRVKIRTDAFSGYQAGLKSRTRQHFKQIVVKTHAGKQRA